jgi:hypothetical protein
VFAGTCQQDEKVELVVLRENNAFKLAGYGEQQQSNMITDSKMVFFFISLLRTVLAYF